MACKHPFKLFFNSYGYVEQCIASAEEIYQVNQSIQYPNYGSSVLRTEVTGSLYCQYYLKDLGAHVERHFNGSASSSEHVHKFGRP